MCPKPKLWLPGTVFIPMQYVWQGKALQIKLLLPLVLLLGCMLSSCHSFQKVEINKEIQPNGITYALGNVQIDGIPVFGGMEMNLRELQIAEAARVEIFLKDFLPNNNPHNFVNIWYRETERWKGLRKVYYL